VSDTRARGTEFLDQPDCDLALATASYRFMEMVNRYFGGIRTVRRFLAAEATERQGYHPLRILDIGSGSCDIPLAVSRWARAHGISVQFTCLEMADHAVGIARAKLAQANDTAITLLQEDAFCHQPVEPYDCAVSSMCFHHFDDAQILALLQGLRRIVTGRVLINDLRRSGLASLAARALLVGSPVGVRHDALLSIQRGFKVSPLRALLEQLDRVAVSVQPVPWFRIAATIRFQPGESS